jgi:Tol biopolymer transport system component
MTGIYGWIGYDPQGRYLAAYYPGDHEYFATVWDADGGEPVLSVGLGSAVRHEFFPGSRSFGPPAAFLPSGSHLVTLPGSAANYLEGRPLGRATGKFLTEMESPDDRPPLSLGLGYWSVWSAPGAKALRRTGVSEQRDRIMVHSTGADKPAKLTTIRDIHLQAKATAVTVSPDLSRLAWAEDSPEADQVITVHVVDIDSGKGSVLESSRPANRTSRLTFSPDGRCLAAGGEDGIVRVWDLETRTQVAVYRGPSYTVGSLAFSPDGALLAYGALEPKGHRNAWVVSTKKGEHAAAWAADGDGVSCLTFDPKGERLAVLGGDRVVRVYAVKDLTPKR